MTTKAAGTLHGLTVHGAPEGRVYLRPLAPFPLPADIDPETTLPLAGGPLAFSLAQVLMRGDGAVHAAYAPLPALREWARRQGDDMVMLVDDWVDRLSAPRPDFAGLPVSGRGIRPLVMGIINVTPDSFSDGGDFADPAAAIAHGLALAAAGADILDVGGESTRPGSQATDPSIEHDRVMPVIEGLGAAGVPISIDTRNAALMRAAVAAGATIINDVSGFAFDPAAAATAADLGVPSVLMHMRGTPETMREETRYQDVCLDVYDELGKRLDAVCRAGMRRERVVVDPGIGFAKDPAQNARLLAGVAVLHGLGTPVLVGASRKSFLGPVTGTARPRERLGASVAAAVAAAEAGVQILRVHDVTETWQAVETLRALREA